MTHFTDYFGKTLLVGQRVMNLYEDQVVDRITPDGVWVRDAVTSKMTCPLPWRALQPKLLVIHPDDL